MRTLILSALLVALPAVSPAADAKPDARVEKARQALAPFKKNLKEALTAALPKGPEAAVAVCNTEAPQIAAKLSTGGVALGRATDKPRNPKNAPADWMRPLMDELAKAPKADGAFAARTLADGRLAYAEPIYVQPLCLTCHGDPAGLAPGVKKILAEKYPDDRATGYKEGDFRGIFWVTVEK